MEQESFVFYRSFLNAIEACPKKSQLAAFLAIARYALLGETQYLVGPEKIVFEAVKPQIDANLKRKECGKKGGRPKSVLAKKDNSQETTELALAKNENKITNGFEFEEPLVIANANQRFPKEKERKQEKESFPPTPPFKEKEINKEKENLSPPQKTRVREEDWLSDYFADCNFLLREPFIKALHAENPDTATDSDLRALADETMAEFARQRQNHSSYSDFANHLENLIRHKNRAKAKAKPKQETEHNAGLKAYVAEQRRLLEAERRRVS